MTPLEAFKQQYKETRERKAKVKPFLGYFKVEKATPKLSKMSVCMIRKRNASLLNKKYNRLAVIELYKNIFGSEFVELYNKNIHSNGLLSVKPSNKYPYEFERVNWKWKPTIIKNKQIRDIKNEDIAEYKKYICLTKEEYRAAQMISLDMNRKDMLFFLDKPRSQKDYSFVLIVKFGLKSKDQIKEFVRKKDSIIKVI